jgi:aspartate kinase
MMGRSDHRSGIRQAPFVWKFGGTSVADHDRLRAAAERMVAAQRSGRGVVAVLSAMGTSTDDLVRQAYALSARPPLRELDALLSVGESISCALAAMAVAELGSRAVSLTGAQAGIRTDDRHGGARVIGISPQRIHDELAGGAIVLVTGFQGVSVNGDVTTLGRGGSDASAVALAGALGARECEIFTDVPAVFTADPRVVPDARRLASVRHDEMLEMAEAGAAVLQPCSVELAVTHGVDIHLRSSFSAEEGTWIRRGGSDASVEVAGIACRRQESLFAVDGAAAGVVVAALAERGISAGALVPDGTGIRFTAPDAEPADVTAALAAADLRASVDEELGSVSVVSLGIARRPGIPVRALAVLEEAGIAPRLVTTTPNRLAVLVPAPDVEGAARLLHEAFVPAASAGTVTDLRPPADAA